jgi:hypothetical protein
MEIDTTRKRGPLSEEQKERRQANRLCLYCGGPGHIAINCQHRPSCQVNQIIALDKPKSCFVETCSNDLSSPILTNKFQVLSQLEEEVN